MAENDNNDGLNTLVGLGILAALGYAGYKVLFGGSKEPKVKNSIESSDIHGIVNEYFVFDDESDFAELLIYYATPGFFSKIKREMLTNALSPKLDAINSCIRQVGESYCQNMPVHGDEENHKFINTLIDKCILKTESIISIIKAPIKMASKFLGNVTAVASNSIMYVALKKAIDEYYSMIYLRNCPMEDATERAMHVYEWVYAEKAENMLDWL